MLVAVDLVHPDDVTCSDPEVVQCQGGGGCGAPVLTPGEAGVTVHQRTGRPEVLDVAQEQVDQRAPIIGGLGVGGESGSHWLILSW